jgi:hypothetical protein
MPDKTLRDPLGRGFVLHDHTWYGHIIKRHPEMESHRALVERAVADPLEIRVSAADPDVRVYFGAGARAGIMTAVFATLSGSFVKTAHFVRTAKGAIEWSKPTP